MATIVKVGPTITAQKIGGQGTSGDELLSLTIVPLSKTPGAVTLYDGDPTGGDFESYVVYAGTPTGSLSIPDLSPIQILLQGVKSKHGPWYVTTSVSVQVLVIGNINTN